MDKHDYGEAPDVKVLAERYEVGEKVGGGSTATVHRGRDLRLQREIAVKLFRVDVDAELQRVQSELQILASLNHPCLVALYDAGEDPEAYLVLEFVEGPTLTQHLLTSGAQEWTDVAVLGAQLADGLAHAHSMGVVHRDVKPSNVLLGSSGAKLTDFGVAQLENQAGITTTGMTVGTAPYLSPEQVQGSRALPASDVYSLGLTLLEALTGERSYPGNGAESAIARLTRNASIPDNIPPLFQSLLTAMTALDPQERPTALEVSHALSRLYSSEESTQYVPIVTAPPAAELLEERPGVVVVEEFPLPAPPVRLQDTVRRRRKLSLLIGLGLLAAVLLTVGILALLDREGAPLYTDNPDEPAVPELYEGPLDRLEELVGS